MLKLWTQSCKKEVSSAAGSKQIADEPTEEAAEETAIPGNTVDEGVTEEEGRADGGESAGGTETVDEDADVGVAGARD